MSRELDAQIARRLFGRETKPGWIYFSYDDGEPEICRACEFPAPWKDERDHRHQEQGFWEWHPEYFGGEGHWLVVPAYSTDPSAALSILDHERFGKVVLERDANGWYCSLSYRTDDQSVDPDSLHAWQWSKCAVAETLAEAICKAARSTVEAKDE